MHVDLFTHANMWQNTTAILQQAHPCTRSLICQNACISPTDRVCNESMSITLKENTVTRASDNIKVSHSNNDKVRIWVSFESWVWHWYNLHVLDCGLVSAFPLMFVYWHFRRLKNEDSARLRDDHETLVQGLSLSQSRMHAFWIFACIFRSARSSAGYWDWSRNGQSRATLGWVGRWEARSGFRVRLVSQYIDWLMFVQSDCGSTIVLLVFHPQSQCLVQSENPRISTTSCTALQSTAEYACV